MSTRATIRISDENDDDVFYVYRHCDGYPESIILDCAYVLNKIKDRNISAETSLIASALIAHGWNFETKRLGDYEITSGFHGDESHRYFIRKVGRNEWEAGEIGHE